MPIESMRFPWRKAGGLTGLSPSQGWKTRIAGALCQGWLRMLPSLLLSLTLSLGQVQPPHATVPAQEAAPAEKDKSQPFASTKDFAAPSSNDCNDHSRRGFLGRLLQAYRDDCHPKSDNGDGDKEKGNKGDGDK